MMLQAIEALKRKNGFSGSVTFALRALLQRTREVSPKADIIMLSGVIQDGFTKLPKSDKPLI